MRFEFLSRSLVVFFVVIIRLYLEVQTSRKRSLSDQFQHSLQMWKLRQRQLSELPKDTKQSWAKNLGQKSRTLPQYHTGFRNLNIWAPRICSGLGTTESFSVFLSLYLLPSFLSFAPPFFLSFSHSRFFLNQMMVEAI